ncbi:hypothetical protein ASF71_21655 [Deinococcus sp. Leaf326]|nr:hypothetical protein ASF71_21655 [Deinococcus sp. Leaf326]
MVRGSLVKPCGLDQTMCISWVWLYRNTEPEQRFVMSNLDLGGKYLARMGKRRWRIEAFFKTVKGRFGLERFAQHVPEVRRQALQLELNALDAFQHALFAPST